jgi:hypothetical protein
MKNLARLNFMFRLISRFYHLITNEGYAGQIAKADQKKTHSKLLSVDLISNVYKYEIKNFLINLSG